MKSLKKSLLRLFLAAITGVSVVSCAMEEPFANVGEGNLTLITDIRGDVTKKTRALGEDELEILRNKCVVYIENRKGVIRKYKGVNNIPSSIRLTVGDYVAEGWSGDSVSASFDAKFYRGYQKFEIGKGENSLTLRCNIANVVVSVDPASLKVHLKDMKVTFYHSRGELVFDESNIGAAKGYFMMPNADKNLNYKIEGILENGQPYERIGVIENVERAHEYAVTIVEDAKDITEGGALIRLIIEDIPIIDEEVEIFTAPAITGRGFAIEEQVNMINSIRDAQIYVRGYKGLSSLTMTASENVTGIENPVNLLEESAYDQLKAKGINVSKKTSTDASPSVEGGQVQVDEVYVVLTAAFLKNYETAADELKFNFEATDGNNLTSTASLRIATTNTALDFVPPIASAPAPDPEKQPMAILAHSATIEGLLLTEDASDYGMKYRKAGDSEWIKVSAKAEAMSKARRTRASETRFTQTITGLEPGTVYEYIHYADDYETPVVNTFTTESIFSIPNSSFEEWSTYKASTMLGTKTVTLPSNTGDKETSFWGSGNEGSATANMTLTDKFGDVKHSGNYSARLQSNSAMGIIAAGNIFIGQYVKTDGTNGVLSLGRSYNGSHPTKLVAWANYRPASGVSVKSGNEEFLPEDFANGKDHGQIYVALTDEPIEIRTNPNNRKLFDADDVHVLAYGQITWTDDFGADNTLERIEIPFKYNERANTTKPLYLIMVASASKYGDYFSGAAGSVIILDDVELVYDK